LIAGLLALVVGAATQTIRAQAHFPDELSDTVRASAADTFDFDVTISSL